MPFEKDQVYKIDEKDQVCKIDQSLEPHNWYGSIILHW